MESEDKSKQYIYLFDEIIKTFVDENKKMEKQIKKLKETARREGYVERKKT